ncbi:hypothetical protein CF328_g9209 [Tilletia controversa]|nr:hypothetical protein CF328_g9209 [Tilletia controversa]
MGCSSLPGSVCPWFTGTPTPHTQVFRDVHRARPVLHETRLHQHWSRPRLLTAHCCGPRCASGFTQALELQLPQAPPSFGVHNALRLKAHRIRENRGG